MLSYRENGKIMDGFQEWLDRYAWDMYATTMFGKEYTEEMTPWRALKFIQKNFFGKIMKDEKQRDRDLSQFTVIEKYKLGGLHAHSLIAGVCQKRLGEWSYSDLGQLWHKESRGGFLKIEAFDHGLCAASYVGKYISKDMCEWDFKIKKAHEWKTVMAKIENDWTMEKEKKERIKKDYAKYRERLEKINVK